MCQKLVLGLEHLGESEVDDGGVAVDVQHDVFGFHVALDDAQVVHVFHAGQHFGQVESQHFCVEEFEFFQVLEKFAIFILIGYEE